MGDAGTARVTTGQPPDALPPSNVGRHPRLALATSFLVLAVASGGLVAWLGRASTASLATGATCAALASPLAIATWWLIRRRRGVVPFLVGLSIVFFFALRLLSLDPSTGLLAVAALTPGEFASSAATARWVLSIFGLAVAAAFLVALPAVPAPVRQSSASREGAYERSVRAERALGLGLAAATAGTMVGLSQGVGARDFTNAAGLGGLLSLISGAAQPVGGALWLARRRALGVFVLGFSLVGPLLTGSRQAVLTPLLYFAVAVLMDYRCSPRSWRLSRRAVGVSVLIVALSGVAVLTIATSRRAEVERAVNDGRQPTLYASLVEGQTLVDPLMVAIAREPRPQGLDIYRRAVLAPIPRVLWPDKPFSYDVDFRARQFPQYGGAIPIGLPGTAFVSFLLPGVLLGGLVVGFAAVAAERVLAGRTARGVLLAAAACVFLPDLIRIGGFYREVISFAFDSAVIVLITRAGPLWPRARGTAPVRSAGHATLG